MKASFKYAKLDILCQKKEVMKYNMLHISIHFLSKNVKNGLRYITKIKLVDFRKRNVILKGTLIFKKIIINVVC